MFSRIKKITLSHIAFVLLIVMSCFLCLQVSCLNKRIEIILPQEHAFAPENVVCKYSYKKEWDVQTSDKENLLVKVLGRQRFKWLAQGYQAYAFISPDGEYVIKFFQQQKMSERPFLERPFSYLFDKGYRRSVVNKASHRQEIFVSSKFCFEELSEETGFVYAHLNRTVKQLPTLTVFDQQGKHHKIKLDDVSFIIQKRAKYIIPTLTKLMNQNKIAEAKQRLDQIFDLLLAIAKKGFMDSDYALFRNDNIGFTKTRAIYIDTGHLKRCASVDLHEQMTNEYKKRLYPLKEWLAITYPELAEYYETRTDAILAASVDK